MGPAGTIVLGGQTFSSNFPLHVAFDSTIAGDSDGFLSMLADPLVFADGLELGSLAEWSDANP